MRVGVVSGVAFALVVGHALASGCAADPQAEDGKETGGCIDNQCLGPDLVCLSNLCVDPSATPDGTAGDDDDDDDDESGDDTGTPPVSSISVLFVVDDSGSMGEEQHKLAAAIGSFITPLEQSGLDWRIGVTSTDNGNPWCDGTTPLAGQLLATSCRGRTSEFVFMGAQMIDATQEACLDVCAHDSVAVTGDKPWLQRIGGDLNLGSNMTAEEALRCLLPQGIAGCGFEQPLESMSKAMARSLTEGELAFGFIPEGARLAVVMVTDEADCSSNPDQATIFLPEGDRTFWSLPDEGAPTSAVCWNAGVACSGGNCEPADLDPLGMPTSGELASMRPVSRYIDELVGVDDAYFAAIVGVSADGSVTYQDAADQGFQDDFGIGPGCTSSDGEAVPPVRIRAVAEATSPADQQLFSICEDSYDAALEAIASGIVSSVSGS